MKKKIQISFFSNFQRGETTHPESNSERQSDVKKVSKTKVPLTNKYQKTNGNIFQGIPIFALHPKGTHYIPMPVEEEVIQPYLHLFEQGPEIPLMLHPITIPVNFCGPIQMAANVSISNAHQGTL